MKESKGNNPTSQLIEDICIQKIKIHTEEKYTPEMRNQHAHN